MDDRRRGLSFKDLKEAASASCETSINMGTKIIHGLKTKLQEQFLSGQKWLMANFSGTKTITQLQSLIFYLL